MVTKGTVKSKYSVGPSLPIISPGKLGARATMVNKIICTNITQELATFLYMVVDHTSFFL